MKRLLLVACLACVLGVACTGGDGGPGAPQDTGTRRASTPKAPAVPTSTGKRLEPACDVLTPEWAAQLLGLTGADPVRLEDDAGDMCIMSSTDGDREVVFELMAFGPQHYAIERNEVRKRTSVTGVGSGAFRAEVDGGRLLDAYQGDVFLSLHVRGVADPDLQRRMEAFARVALIGY